jgi:site-specific recombinase XerD
VYGTLGGERIRRALDQTAWEAASDLVAGWTASGEIGVVRPDVPGLREAATKFLEDGQARHLTEETLKKHRQILLGKLVPWLEARGLTRLKQIEVDHLREFRGSWSYSPIAAQKRLEDIRAFFRFCVNSNWIQRNPSSAVKNPQVEPKAVEPFTDDEIDRMLDAAAKFNERGKKGNRARIRAMILLLRYTGLRISDASTLARAEIVDGKLKLRTEKTGAVVWLPLPKDLIEALDDVQNPGDYYFWNGRSKKITPVYLWWNTFSRVFELAEIPKHKRFIHNFRHTAATNLLSKGVDLETVATILGNSPKIVLKHYSHWIPARQQALEAAVRHIWT